MKKLLLTFAVLLVCSTGPEFVVLAQQRVDIPADLTQRAVAEGSVRVIVRIDVPVQPEGQLAAAAVTTQRQAIAASQAQVLTQLGGTNYRVVRAFDTLPFLALEVAPDALAALAQSAAISTIEEDRLLDISLAQSTPLVEATAAWSAGFDGTGWTVAVLDTGVDRFHSFLAGKVIAEACFSANANCPNGTTTQIGTGAGAPCTYAALACRHGTHVAGIAAGRGTTFSGVARGANIISIQVFSRVVGNCAGAGEDPCARTFFSDVMAGLNHVYALRNSTNIAAANMSLGGSSYTDQALCDAQNSSLKMAIDLLRSAGIASVIASGNGANTGAPFIPGIGTPACISSAVSVGNTTKSDTINPSSQTAPFLSLLAPGTSIQSSIPGGGFAFFDGTSMAAPHVAGAWAIIKQRAPSASVTTVLDALRTRGLAIFDARNGVTTPRIRILQALNAFITSSIFINDVSTTEGNSGTKTLTFTASLSQAGTAPIAVNYATADLTATAGASLSNASPIGIPAGGNALLYPSTIAVGPGVGLLSKVTVTLSGFSHTFPGDVDVLLVGPTGASVMLMSDVGGGVAAAGISLTFDDAAAALATSPLTSGTFRPTNVNDNEGTDTFDPPAPASPYGSSLMAAFGAIDPAGQWRLFVRDDFALADQGTIAGGWSMVLSGSGGDYVARSGTLNFPAGSTTQPIAITINGDTVIEPAETFRVLLSNATGASIADSVGIGTILNDDTFIFTDPSLSGLSIKALHLVELRTAINGARAIKGLTPFAFMDPGLGAGTPIKAVHIMELRTALTQAYTAAKLTPPAFTDPTLVAGATMVKAAHIVELRNALLNLP